MNELLNQSLPSPEEEFTPHSVHKEEGLGVPASEANYEDLEPYFKDLIMVHMSPREADQLDYMQGGKILHPETELRAYPGIAKMIKNTDFKVFLNDLAEEILTSGHADNHVKKLTKALPHIPVLDKFEPAPGDFSDEGIKLDSQGAATMKGDDETVHIPIEWANYLDHLRGGKIVNPVDGLRQYGLLSKVAKFVHRSLGLQKIGIKMTHVNEGIRIAATVGGYMIGGPIGAGFGNALGNYATGADFKKSAWRGAKVGAAASAAEALAGAAMGGFGSQAAAPTFVNGVEQAAPAAAGAGAGAGAGTSAAGATKAAAAESLLPSWLLPAASVGLMMHGRGQEKKDAKKAQEEHRAEIAAFRKSHGLDAPLMPMVYKESEYDPEPQADPYSVTYGKERRHFRNVPNYSHGGKVKNNVHLLPGEEYLTRSKLIKAKGKGQDDTKPVNVPEDTYIVDASTVSRTGDGSSEAGANEWLKLAKAIEGKAHKLKHKIKLSERRVPTMLSNDEVALHPIVSAVLGGGSTSKGADNLKKTIKNIRAHTSNGDKLPPQVKSIVNHLPPSGKKILKQLGVNHGR